LLYDRAIITTAFNVSFTFKATRAFFVFMIKDTNLRGILIMLASMAIFSAADTLVKMATTIMSTAQVMFYLMGGALVVFALIAKIQGDRLNDIRAFSPILLLRYFVEVAGMVGMVTALAKIPMSTVGAITQATPMLAAVGAVLFLQEKVGWRRWASIIVGFIGVLLIVQPGAVAFDINVLWALLALVAMSVRDLTTRMVPTDIPSASLATYTMAAAAPFTVAWLLFNGDSFMPAQINWWIIVPMIICGALGYLLLIASLRMAEVSVVMPYRYSRIIFLLILGVLVFGERPDAWMVTGATLIIVSGVYMMWREHLARRETL